MAHIKAYTRGDGTLVHEHEDTRQAVPWWVKVLDRVKNPPKGNTGHPVRPTPYYPKAKPHPQANDQGRPVQINEPHEATPPITWNSPHATATFIPGGDTPSGLNGVAFEPWADAPTTEDGWAQVPGQISLHEPTLKTAQSTWTGKDGKPITAGKGAAAGVIVEEEDGRIWVIHPTNQFGGYSGTFPKGHREQGMSLQATAIKEAFEESGLQVAITGFAGDIERSTTTCRYYTARRVGGTPAAAGWETQAVSLVPRKKLYSVLNRSVDHDMAEAMGAGPQPEPPKPAWAGHHHAGEKPSGGYPWASPKGQPEPEPAPQRPWWEWED